MTRKWVKVGCYVMPSYSIHVPILYGKQIKTNLSCLKILLNKEHIDGTDTSAGRGVFLEDCRIFYSLDNLLLYQLGWNIYGYRRSLSGNVWKLILHISTMFFFCPHLCYSIIPTRRKTATCIYMLMKDQSITKTNMIPLTIKWMLLVDKS